jgi:hypothetical protein
VATAVPLRELAKYDQSVLKEEFRVKMKLDEYITVSGGCSKNMLRKKVFHFLKKKKLTKKVQIKSVGADEYEFTLNDVTK